MATLVGMATVTTKSVINKNNTDNDSDNNSNNNKQQQHYEHFSTLPERL